MEKNIVFFEKINSSEFKERALREDGRRTASLPLETLLCLGQIDLYYYTRQQYAFDHGMDLVETIDAYFIAAHAQGQHGSLLPADGPVRLPVTDLPWLKTPEGQKFASLNGEETLEDVWDIFANL